MKRQPITTAMKEEIAEIIKEYLIPAYIAHGDHIECADRILSLLTEASSNDKPTVYSRT